MRLLYQREQLFTGMNIEFLIYVANVGLGCSVCHAKLSLNVTGRLVLGEEHKYHVKYSASTLRPSMASTSISVFPLCAPA